MYKWDILCSQCEVPYIHLIPPSSGACTGCTIAANLWPAPRSQRERPGSRVQGVGFGGWVCFMLVPAALVL